MQCLILVDEKSWFIKYVPTLEEEIKRRFPDALTRLGHDHRAETGAADVCLLLSYERVVDAAFLARHRHNLVVHASALPQGKGMSPATWQILEGKNLIPLTLFEAAEGLDSGPVYLRDELAFEGHELVEEIREAIAAATVRLMGSFFDAYPAALAKPQEGAESRYPRRGPADSELDPHKSIAEQFNLLRVCDNERYPAFFHLHGRKYVLKIHKG